jgi:hypothetical protein
MIHISFGKEKEEIKQLKEEVKRLETLINNNTYISRKSKPFLFFHQPLWLTEDADYTVKEAITDILKYLGLEQKYIKAIAPTPEHIELVKKNKKERKR